MVQADKTNKLKMKYILAGIGVLLSVALLGCNSNHTLGGKVTFSDDGAPVPHGIVTFSTSQFQSVGAIRSDGSYVVGTMKLDDGIPPGTYTVTVGGVEEVTHTETLADGSTINHYRSMIDTKYESPATSGLTFTADGKTQKFDIQLDRAPKK